MNWGRVKKLVIFLAVLVYALWPSRKAQKRFDDAANIPLKED